MKKLFKNKKILLSLAVAGIIAASGLTYAWFRQTIVTPASNVSMGALHLNAEITPIWREDGYVYEPGLEGVTEYVFTNPKTYATIPTVDTIVKLDTAGDMYVRLLNWDKWVEDGSDQDVAPEYLPIEPVYPDHSEFFAAYFEMDSSGYWEVPVGEPDFFVSGAEDGSWSLMKTTQEYNDANGLTTSDVYLIVEGGRTYGDDVVVPAIKIGMKLAGVDASGEGLENNPYMGAELLYGSMVNGVFEEGVGELVATQAHEEWNDEGFVEGAADTEWGIIASVDLEWYHMGLLTEDAAPGTVSPYSYNVEGQMKAEQLLQKIFDRIRN